MAADQKQNRLPVLGIEVQPLQRSLGHLQAGFHMIGSRHTLPNVMKQKGKVEQLRLLQLFENVAVALIPLGRRLPGAMQAFNCQKRVFVHGEAVVVIAHHQRIDELQLRQQQSQQMQRVHRAQSIRGVRFDENGLQRSPQLGALRWMSRQWRARPARCDTR